MKLLIRTITFGSMLFFLTLIVIHSTIVEVTKQEINSASINALYRTIDAYQENQKLIDEGDTSSLYFVTDQDYYDYFYDSLMVQLNGKMKVIISCNEANVGNGDLDVDITANYRAIGRDIKEYTFHVDTYGRIKHEINYTDEQKLLNRKLAEAPIGQKIKFANKDWILIEDKNDIVTLLSADNKENTEFGNTEKYSMSVIEFKNKSFMDTGLREYSDYLENTTLDNLNTLNSLYVEDGTDETTGQIFSLSKKQAEKLVEANINGQFWLRTASNYNKVYYYNNGTIEEREVSAQLPYRPAINVIKSKLSSLTEEGDTFILETNSQTFKDVELDNVSNVGWDVRNDDILRVMNSLPTGTYKLSALITIKEGNNAQRGDQYGIKINDAYSLYSYSEIILNNPVYFETTFTVDNVGSFSDLRLYGCGTGNNQTGTADFTQIKIEKLY